MKILIVDDQQSLRDLLADHLRRCGFAVEVAGTGGEAIACMQASRYDALILDLGLPDMDGAQILAARKADRQGSVPCIVLTARDALESRVASLNAGADDYVLKPFAVPELEARLRAVLRRTVPGYQALSRGNLSFEPASRHAVVAGQVLDLPRRE